MKHTLYESTKREIEREIQTIENNLKWLEMSLQNRPEVAADVAEYKAEQEAKLSSAWTQFHALRKEHYGNIAFIPA